ncbi:MAG: hypothetical protein H6711_15810 [Myxococcales bacterium]|nr:hypothetical protein [Myxococcales bacterium]
MRGLPLAPGVCDDRSVMTRALAPLLLLAACAGGGGSGSSEGPTGAASTGASASASASTSTTASGGTTSATSGATGSGAGSTAAATSTGGESSGGLLDHCPTVATPIKVATIQDPEIDEASGLVASRSQPGVFWTHNDSGDGPRIFAIDGSGATLGTFTLKGAKADDWEDMAIGPGPSPGEWLYLGDIGDNSEVRRSITVYRVREPDAASAGGGAVAVDGAQAIALTYPDGAHNAETLMVDPQTGDLVIVAKGDPTRVFTLAAPIAAGGPFELAELAPINAPATFATGGDISPLGDFIAVRTYFEAHLWLRPPGASVGEALAGEPCTIPLAIELQGETLAIDPEGAGYYTLSEMAAQPLWRMAFEG